MDKIAIERSHAFELGMQCLWRDAGVTSPRQAELLTKRAHAVMAGIQKARAEKLAAAKRAGLLAQVAEKVTAKKDKKAPKDAVVEKKAAAAFGRLLGGLGSKMLGGASRAVFGGKAAPAVAANAARGIGGRAARQATPGVLKRLGAGTHNLVRGVGQGAGLNTQTGGFANALRFMRRNPRTTGAMAVGVPAAGMAASSAMGGPSEVDQLRQQIAMLQAQQGARGPQNWAGYGL